MKMEKNKILKEMDDVIDELYQLILPLSQEQLNIIPFKDSWTAAQLATHVTKSNNGIAQALEMEGSAPARNADEKVKGLQDAFLNFSVKMKSPSFIVPEEKQYIKEAVVTSLKKSSERLQEKAAKANAAEMIDLPAAFGEITKLELFHFVVYHTKRHIHQLKNILHHI